MKFKRTNISLNDETFVKLKWLADKTRRTRSEIVRDLISSLHSEVYSKQDWVDEMYKKTLKQATKYREVKPT